MAKIKCASTMKKGDIQTIETYLEKAPSHIIHCLLGIYGQTPGDVINFIVKNWIKDNDEQLRKLGISFTVKNSNWQAESFEDSEESKP